MTNLSTKLLAIAGHTILTTWRNKSSYLIWPVALMKYVCRQSWAGFCFGMRLQCHSQTSRGVPFSKMYFITQFARHALRFQLCEWYSVFVFKEKRGRIKAACSALQDVFLAGSPSHFQQTFIFSIPYFAVTVFILEIYQCMFIWYP